MKNFFSLFVRFILLLVALLKVDLVMGQEIAAAKDKAELYVAAKISDSPFGQESGHTTTIAKSKAAIEKQPTTLGNTSETERLKLWVAHKTFSTKKTLGFTLKQPGNYKLEVLDMQGTIVAVLGEGFGQEREELTFQFKGEKLPAGTYIGRLITEDEVTSTRFILK
ncbi:T9SS type A sorting domain-containing protein [Pontibacter pudoricolor]|uniref:T9SS type A sorting domain-containing protein n=1 Tax=Pontibacter pudoricolor TaxID=2694930 RepID=UPI0013918714|nr:T9SS type A sorting domain-containing protein [Pontibacter pudoricolor]